jgi:hypothetical protein
MAYMIPEELGTGASAGERTLFRALRTLLPSDYAVYARPEIDGNRLDFVVIGPDLGIVVLTIQEFTRASLVETARDEWQVYTAAGKLEAVPNPYVKAKTSSRYVADRLMQDERLIVTTGKRSGQLKLSLGFGAVFTRLKRQDFVELELFETIAESFVLSRDEFDAAQAGFQADSLIEKLHGMFTDWSRPRSILAPADFQAIRSHLMPEVQLGAQQLLPATGDEQLILSEHPLQALDLQQESIAKQLGDRHRLIRGVAGSGKTLVLATRANILAKHYPDWRILVLCRSIPLSRNLRYTINRMMDEPEDLLDWIRLEEERDGKPHLQNVEVYNFHQWLGRTLNVKETEIPLLIGKLERKEAILPMYEAILIDEGQDFQPAWLRLLSHLLNPATQNLLLVEDQAQSYRKRKTSLLRETGLDFRGRSRVLSVNYRNTAQIAWFAWNFYQRHSQMRNKLQYGTVKGVEIIPPQSASRTGDEPIIQRCGSFREELQTVVRRIRKLHEEQRVALADMAILYRVKDNYHSSYVDAIRREFAAQGLPVHWNTEEEEQPGSGSVAGAVCVSSIEAAKGLDFRAVFIVNAESLPFVLEEVEEREVSLFYVAMTRALEWLHISYSGESKYTLYLDEQQKQRLEQPAVAERMG